MGQGEGDLCSYAHVLSITLVGHIIAFCFFAICIVPNSDVLLFPSGRRAKHFAPKTIAFGQDLKPMSTEPLHRLTTEQEAKRIMDEQEQNTKMEDLLEATSTVGLGGLWWVFVHFILHV